MKEYELTANINLDKLTYLLTYLLTCDNLNLFDRRDVCLFYDTKGSLSVYTDNGPFVCLIHLATHV